jgi:uncharacterized protein
MVESRMIVAHSRAPLFLDSAYVMALVNVRDQWQSIALRWEEYLTPQRRRIVTTEFILIEIADGLAAVSLRAQAAGVMSDLRRNNQVEIVPANSDLFAAALGLYRNRADKWWGLTDCSSFIVMEQYGLRDALTSDEHFRQAGFRALLLENPPR